MPYDPKQLFLLTQSGGGAGQTWRYEGTDTPAAVAAAGFLSDAYQKGMNVGDVVEVVQFASSAKASVTQVARFLATAVVANTGATLGEVVAVSGTAVSAAVTVNGLVGKITTEALTTAAAAEYTCTVTNSHVAAGDIVLVHVDPKTSAGTPGLGGVMTSVGKMVITVTNLHASAAFDAAIGINFVIVK